MSTYCRKRDKKKKREREASDKKKRSLNVYKWYRVIYK